MFHYVAKLAQLLSSLGSGHHAVDGDGVPRVATRCIKDLAVLLAWAFEVALRGDKEVRNEPGKPVREGGHEIVAILFVHCGQDLQ